MSSRIRIIAPFLLAACAETEPARPQAADCATESPTLEALVDCIEARMPRNDSGGFVAPSAAQKDAWRAAVAGMLEGRCDPAPPGLDGLMAVRTFVDADGGKPYCVLLETRDAGADGTVDHGFGTFIVDADARIELNHAAPHPYTDIDSEDQAIGAFKQTGSRSFLMAGTTRDASLETSRCNDYYSLSDVAHDVENMFFATTGQLIAHYESRDQGFWQIQWHGISDDLCSEIDVFISHGNYEIPPPAGDLAFSLRDNLLKRHPTWKIALDGESCDYDGWSNTSGRLLNGIPAADVCIEAPASLSGRFFHVEHHLEFRKAKDWSEAIVETFAAREDDPARP